MMKLPVNCNNNVFSFVSLIISSSYFTAWPWCLVWVVSDWLIVLFYSFTLMSGLWLVDGRFSITWPWCLVSDWLLAGVKSVLVSLMAQKADIRFDPDLLTATVIAGYIDDIGFTASVIDERAGLSRSSIDVTVRGCGCFEQIFWKILMLWCDHEEIIV